MNEVFKIEEKQDVGNYRTLFARDRDRIMYSRDFLRLKGKTQIFIEGYDDYMRNRLTHTLEVSQLSQKISSFLNMSNDLTNAIAYGHDIGHTPFGHAGERILNSIMNGCYKIMNTAFIPIEKNRGFKHNWQGIRVLRDLNNTYTGGAGFEISKQTEWGVLHHTKLEYDKCDKAIEECICGNIIEKNEGCKWPSGFSIDFYTNLYSDVDMFKYFTFESLIVEKADEIAQRHHDIEDGLIGKLISLEEIVKLFPSKESLLYKNLGHDEKDILSILESKDEKAIKPILKKMTHFVISLYVKDLIENSISNLKNFQNRYKLKKEHEFYTKYLESDKIDKYEVISLIDFSDELKVFDKKIKKFLKTKILNSFIVQSMDSKAEYIILKLVDTYMERPQYLPKNTISSILNRIIVVIPKIAAEINSEQGEKEDYSVFITKNHLKYLRDKIYLNYFLRGVCDFVAGMTDDFAYKQFNLIFGTEKISSHIYK